MGREALATIGYLQLIHFAREAGWVTVKEGRRTSTSSRAMLSMDAVQAEAMREFTEVFSKYAVIAGVTSQSDTPLPGPMDLAAIGVLVFGLIAAGYVAVSVLDAVGNAPPPAAAGTTSSPPVATTMPTATTVPTADAPPLALTRPRRYPYQTCEEDVREELGRQKDAACKTVWSCKNDVERLGKKKEMLLSCAELLLRIAINKGCLDARKRVQDECFKGSPDPGHEEVIKGVTNALNECMRKAAIRGPGGGPC